MQTIRDENDQFIDKKPRYDLSRHGQALHPRLF